MGETVISLSGGIGSWYAAHMWIKVRGPEGVHLVFADTLIEDEDLYRFLDDIEADFGIPITRIADGRDPWEVFRDERMIGNTRADPCSKYLKRLLLRRWVRDNISGQATIVVGIDHTEQHRLKAIEHNWVADGHIVDAPLCWDGLVLKDDAIAELNARGIKPPRLYAMGFPHNNCGGFCVKAGQAQFYNLLKLMPERYAHHEAKEEETRVYLGKDVAVLRDRRGGETNPMTMAAFRERIEADPDDFDKYDWGSACDCMGGQLELPLGHKGRYD